jgi:hypothetical protein
MTNEVGTRMFALPTAPPYGRRLREDLDFLSWNNHVVRSRPRCRSSTTSAAHHPARYVVDRFAPQGHIHGLDALVPSDHADRNGWVTVLEVVAQP